MSLNIVLNLSTVKSRLRIQLQTDPRYQSFLKRGVNKNILGYEMMVATLKDILKGKSGLARITKEDKVKGKKI